MGINDIKSYIEVLSDSDAKLANNLLQRRDLDELELLVHSALVMAKAKKGHYKYNPKTNDIEILLTAVREYKRPLSVDDIKNDEEEIDE